MSKKTPPNNSTMDKWITTSKWVLVLVGLSWYGQCDLENADVAQRPDNTRGEKGVVEGPDPGGEITRELERRAANQPTPSKP